MSVSTPGEKSGTTDIVFTETPDEVISLEQALTDTPGEAVADAIEAVEENVMAVAEQLEDEGKPDEAKELVTQFLTELKSLSEKVDALSAKVADKAADTASTTIATEAEHAEVEAGGAAAVVEATIDVVEGKEDTPPQDTHFWYRRFKRN